MAWTISPDTFDVVVIGSGLPECLVAASLVKSGKSVLIIDPVDTYGTDFASFTPAALQDALLSHRQPEQAGASAPAPTAADAAGPATTDLAPKEPRDEEQEHEHSLPAERSPVSEPLPPGSRLLPLRQRALPLSGIRALAAPGEGGGPEDRRGYILDLVPKLVYQSEPLVDLLVRCRCHHYLEFKAVEGSYLLQDGALQPVPAGRADIFRDRRLGLADKRALMRFIQGCVEARNGGGHLREALSSSRPLAEILAAEGLPLRLREVILYGIAMCDTDQELTLTTAAAPAPSGSGAAAGVMTGAEGGSALDLFTGSQGRFGHEGAFMIPSYGSGSVAEAFVRLCAVHGAVTVLRQPVQALLVAAAAGERDAAEAKPEPDPAAEAEAAQKGAEVVGRAAGETPTMVTAGPEADAASDQGGGGEGDGSGGGGAAAAAATGPHVTAIVTAAGQVVRCGTVVAAVSTLSGLEGVAAPSASAEFVSRAVAVLDGPLLPAAAAPSASTSAVAGQQPAQPQAPGGGGGGLPAPKSLLTLVVPPRCPGVVAAASATSAGAGPGAVGLGNPHPVRLLQGGPSTCVCPAGRSLLYLSTPATSDSSYDDLWPTLDLLVDTSQLRDMSASPTSPSAPSSSPPSSSAPAPGAAAAAAAGSSEPTTAADAALSHSQPWPRALRAWFYRQPVLHRREAASGALAGHLPGGVVPLPGPDGGLAGYSEVLEATEAAYRAAFPDLKWLAEVDFAAAGDGGQGDGEGNGEEGGGGGGAAAAPGDDEEDGAIDELTAALARLKDGWGAAEATGATA